ncbi:MAG: four helix bundle protein, partial [Crenarchaeota archaeon]|nr:four helix bundle protein [Thermoproteota archaeon]
MGKIERFEDLDVWQKSRELTRQVYAASGSGEFSRDFGLKDQMRRASVSIMSNIAEGFERGSNKEFIQFLYIAKGSAGELRAQLCVASDQGYIAHACFTNLGEATSEVARMLSGLISYLSTSELR